MLSEIQKLFPEVLRADPLSGGDINDVFKVKMENGPAVLKWNRSVSYPGMFEKEAQGLDLLRTTDGPRIPEVIEVRANESWQGLLIEWLPSGIRMGGFDTQLGQELASIHRQTNESFGLDHDNYIGSLEQSNSQEQSFATFYHEHRLWPLAKKGEHYLGSDFLKDLELLGKKLPSLFPKEPPALLHGDLWGGNLHVGPEGEPCLIDPAVYYGHREIDLAMTRLFGGFGREFYSSYHEAYPLSPGSDERIDLWQLYPLLVHVNLFGSTYVGSAKSALARYIR